MLTISNPKMIDEVVAKFIIKNLPKISGQSDYKSLKEIIRVLYASADTIPTTMDGGKYSNIGLIINDTQYAT